MDCLGLLQNTYHTYDSSVHQIWLKSFYFIFFGKKKSDNSSWIFPPQMARHFEKWNTYSNCHFYFFLLFFSWHLMSIVVPFSFSGSKVIKLFFGNAKFSRNYLLEVSKFKKIIGEEEKIQKLMETRGVLFARSVHHFQTHLSNISLSYNLVEHYFSPFLQKRKKQ